jgi:hypothetical protein
MFTISKGIGESFGSEKVFQIGNEVALDWNFNNGCDHQHKSYEWNNVSSFVTRLMCNYHCIECDKHTIFNSEITKLMN